MRAVREHLPTLHAPVNFLRVQEPVFDAPWHFHPEYEITWIVRGEGMRFVGDSAMPFVENDLVLIGPELPHYWCSHDSEASRGGLAEAVVCHFRHDFLGEGLWQVSGFDRVRDLLARSGRGLSFDVATGNLVRQQLGRLASMRAAARAAALLSILVSLSEASESTPLASVAYRPVVAETNQPRMQRLMRLVETGYASDITLNEAARCAAMTPTAFCRYFRQQTGRSFVVFLTEIRIRHACQALMTTGDLVVDIAERCGYRNMPNFNRQFKHITGRTPREYRRQFQN